MRLAKAGLAVNKIYSHLKRTEKEVLEEEGEPEGLFPYFQQELRLFFFFFSNVPSHALASRTHTVDVPSMSVG